jgi:hypothetical protein
MTWQVSHRTSLALVARLLLKGAADGLPLEARTPLDRPQAAE